MQEKGLDWKGTFRSYWYREYLNRAISVGLRIERKEDKRAFFWEYSKVKDLGAGGTTKGN